MTHRNRCMTLTEVKGELAETARIGQMFVDGDLCRKIWQPYAETFMIGDDMDYNPEFTVPVKKTLMRLERLCRVPCGTALWRRRPDFPDCGEALLFGGHTAPQGGDKPANRGYKPPPLTPELRQVFLNERHAWLRDARASTVDVLVGRGVTTPVRGTRTASTLQVFVPVKDSMGDVAAALEVFTVVVKP